MAGVLTDSYSAVTYLAYIRDVTSFHPAIFTIEKDVRRDGWLKPSEYITGGSQADSWLDG